MSNDNMEAEKMKMMLYIDLAEEELGFFEELYGRFPNKIIISKEMGFDTATSVQIVIDVAEILKESIPYIVTAVEALLLYRIQKKQIEIGKKQNELEQAKLDFEREKEKARLDFEREKEKARLDFEREKEQAKLDFEKEKENKTSFEIHYTSANGETKYLIKGSDSEEVVADENKLHPFVDKLKNDMEAMNKGPKNNRGKR